MFIMCLGKLSTTSLKFNFDNIFKPKMMLRVKQNYVKCCFSVIRLNGTNWRVVRVDLIRIVVYLNRHRFLIIHFASIEISSGHIEMKKRELINIIKFYGNNSIIEKSQNYLTLTNTIKIIMKIHLCHLLTMKIYSIAFA